MSFENRNYMIFSTSESGSINFSEVLESSVNTLRISNDGSLTFVKWEGDTIPSSVNLLTTKEGPYTYTEIKTILSGTEWTSTEEI